MIMVKPHFYDAFRCTASACADNCCIGWEIDIDRESFREYQSLPGPVGEAVRAGIAGGSAPHFRLRPDGRCALLNEHNLCRIQLAGARLCAVCAEHPRFYEWYGARMEAGLGLCCEEACRLLLADPAPLRFVSQQDGAPEEPFAGDAALLERLTAERERFYALLQDRSRPVFSRLRALLAGAEALQDAWDGFPPGPPTAPPDPSPEQLLALLREMEPLDADWTQRLARMQGAPDRPETAPDWVYEHAAVYLLYRWFLKAAFDGDILGKARMAVLFPHLARLLLRRGGASTPQEALRLLSKEIEYSQENTDRMQAFDWTH